MRYIYEQIATKFGKHKQLFFGEDIKKINLSTFNNISMYQNHIVPN